MKFSAFIVVKKCYILFLLLGFLSQSFAQDRGAIVNIQRVPIVPLLAKALLIANSNYEDEAFIDLNQPKEDVDKIKKIICERYQFVDSNVLVIYDADTETLQKCFRKLGNHEGDVFIFYAGHGEKFKKRDGIKESSYIIPVDFKPGTDVSLFLTYEKIKTDFFEDEDKNTVCQHFLFISDACFSGVGIDLMRMRSSTEYEEKEEKDVFDSYSKPVAVGIGSTLNSETPDNSVFTEKFCKILGTHTKNYWLSSKEIYNEIYRDFDADKSKTNSQKPMRKQSTESSDFFFFLKPEFSKLIKEKDESNQSNAAGVDKKTESTEEKKLQSFFRLETPKSTPLAKVKVEQLRKEVKVKIEGRASAFGGPLQWADEDESTLKLTFELIDTRGKDLNSKNQVQINCLGTYGLRSKSKTIFISIKNPVDFDKNPVDFEKLINDSVTFDEISSGMIDFATHFIFPNM